jgi:hypothetical protein
MDLSKYKPMEEAPTDGTPILAVDETAHCPSAYIVHWSEDVAKNPLDIPLWVIGYKEESSFKCWLIPTHWIEIPGYEL